ncbi:TPA: O-antigen ligase family protein [Vibrio parahaemolyticus]|nr:O-antigen ligase domain-containing protein [Vibrio parahaemolyticus]
MKIRVLQLIYPLFAIALLEFLLTGNRGDHDSTFNFISLSKYLLICFYLMFFSLNSMSGGEKSLKVYKSNSFFLLVLLFLLSIVLTCFFNNSTFSSYLGIAKIILIMISCHMMSLNFSVSDLCRFWDASVRLTLPIVCFVITLGIINNIVNGFSRTSFFIFNLTHYLPYVIVMFIYVLLCYKGSGKKTYAFILFLYIVITASRGGIAGLILSLGLSYILFYKDNLTKKMWFVFLGGISSLLVIVVLLYLRSSEISSLSDEPYRYILIQAALQGVLENPLTGNGYLTFVEKSKALATGVGLELVKSKSTHNTHLELAYSFGILAYILFLCFFYYSVKSLKKCFKYNKEFSLFYMASLGYLFIHSFTANMESSPLLWFVICSSLNLQRYFYEENRSAML